MSTPRDRTPAGLAETAEVKAEGMRSLLSFPWAYQMFFQVIGGARRNRVLVRDFICPSPGERVMDIGCGPGTIVPYLEDVNYLGIDVSAAYVDQARRSYPGLRFECKRVSEYVAGERECFDVVLALGILHHLDDGEATALFQHACDALRPGGRLITLDGAWVNGQSEVARYLLRHDRGGFVRNEAEYVALARRVFPETRSVVRHDLLRIPYTHVILTCVR